MNIAIFTDIDASVKFASVRLKLKMQQADWVCEILTFTHHSSRYVCFQDAEIEETFDEEDEDGGVPSGGGTFGDSRATSSTATDALFASASSSARSVLHDKYKDQLLRDIVSLVDQLSSPSCSPDAVFKTCNQLVRPPCFIATADYFVAIFSVRSSVIIRLRGFT